MANFFVFFPHFLEKLESANGLGPFSPPLPDPHRDLKLLLQGRKSGKLKIFFKEEGANQVRRMRISYFSLGMQAAHAAHGGHGPGAAADHADAAAAGEGKLF